MSEKKSEMSDEQATKMFQAKAFPGLAPGGFLDAEDDLSPDEEAIHRKTVVTIAEAFGVFVVDREKVEAGEKGFGLGAVLRAVAENAALHERSMVHARLEQCVLDLLPLVEGSDIDTNESPELVWPRLVARLKEAASRASLPGVRS